MAKPIVERALGTNNPYTSNFLDATYRLAMSIAFVTTREAYLYNDQIKIKYGREVNEFDRRTWRYYMHLTAQYHEVDTFMTVISRDNKEEITLTKDILKVHVLTREELLEFGELYESVIARYPEQQNLLKAMINDSQERTIDEVIDMDDWTIVSYVTDFVEKQESDLMSRLQKRIDHFKIRNLIGHYANSENLYHSSQFVTASLQVVLAILGIRLENVKTGRTHSYHILNYFASHHHLDGVYDYLDDYQRFFLYRNLKYLDCHAGRNDTMDTIISVFFTRKRISVANYIFKQINSKGKDGTMDYVFQPEILNKEDMTYDDAIHDLDDLAEKEIQILDKNAEEYEFNKDEIDDKMKDTTNSELKTKDLEIATNDNSDDVRIKLIDVLCDYWATTLHLGYNNAFIEYVNPIDGQTYNLSPKDAFKLFSVAVMKSRGSTFEFIPDYHAWFVFRETQFSHKYYMSKLENPTYQNEEHLKMFIPKIPAYRYFDTRKQFRTFVEEIYRYELGMWQWLGSEGDLWVNMDMERIYTMTHRPYVLSQDRERIVSFLDRIDFKEFGKYNEDQYLVFIRSFLNSVSSGLLDASEISRLTQEAATTIFGKFKSYTTQVLSEYKTDNRIILGLEAPRFSLGPNDKELILDFPVDNLIQCITNDRTHVFDIDLENEIGVCRDRCIHLELDAPPDFVVHRNTDLFLGLLETSPECITMSFNYEKEPPVLSKEVMLEIIKRQEI